MSYEVIFDPGALREFDRLPQAVQTKITAAIDGLAEDPRPPGAIKLAGVDAYRIRVQAYRVAYAVRDDRLVVLIVKVAHRRDIYREIETIRRRLKE